MALRKKSKNNNRFYLYLPLRDQVVFPHQKTSVNFLASPAYMEMITRAHQEDKNLVLIYADFDNHYNLYDHHTKQNYLPIGTEIKVTRLSPPLADNSVKIFIEAIRRVQILDFVWQNDPCVIVDELKLISSAKLPHAIDNLRAKFDVYAKGKNVPVLVLSRLKITHSAEQILGILAPFLNLHTVQKKELILELDLFKNILKLIDVLDIEIELNNLQHNIDNKIKQKSQKNHRDHFLKEKITELEKELNYDNPSPENELLQKLQELEIDEKSKSKVLQEYDRFKRAPAMTTESALLRTYLEWILDLPWNAESQDNKDILVATALLNEQHYSLDDLKERILDFIAIKQRNADIQSPILCFVGPPGTGKTSLGKSIADALSREYARISLGGTRDEAEIRGHRKTYVGALPGKILQSLKRAGTKNPVIILDEIDKLGNDYRGDPAAALLEVLDPEQNINFVDNYLEIPFDLSKVMFVATANDASNIPIPLLDRMEIIEVPSYTAQEKLTIATRFLLPKQIKLNKLDPHLVHINDTVLNKIIHEYTREAGVRGLNKQLARLLRKSVRLQLASCLSRPGNHYMNSAFIHESQPHAGRQESLFLRPFYDNPIHVEITEEDLATLLGNARFRNNKEIETLLPGVALGLAWTQVGGTIMPIETLFIRGKGKIILTGKLGDVMKESASLAISYIRHRFADNDLFDDDFFDTHDIHIHVPEGATPKDGPSAGTTLSISILSALLKKPLTERAAMTGEITLTGGVLAVGGIKEKVLAAYRHDVTHLFLPEKNRLDFDELDDEVKSKLTVEFVDNVDCIVKRLFPEMIV